MSRMILAFVSLLILGIVGVGCITNSTTGAESVGSNGQSADEASPSTEPTPENANEGETGKGGTRIALPKEAPDNPDSVLSGDMQVATDRRFERETTMSTVPGKDRVWQNGPTPEQIAAYRKSREPKPVTPVGPSQGDAGMPVFDSGMGLTEVKAIGL